MITRPRRLRATETIRSFVRETRVSPAMLVYPIFVRAGRGITEEISSLPGQYRYSPDTLPRMLERVVKSGVRAVLLFGIPESKDAEGSGAWAEDGVVQQALMEGKRHFPDLLYISDVCLCEYTSHGHCGVICDGGYVDGDKTLPLLAKTALSHVRAGADIVAPSDMMDGRVGAIRRELEEQGFSSTAIMSYAVKYASAFYGPFREAAGSAPAFGDRKSYQMDPHNQREALREMTLDINEGADLLIVKPGLPYLDVLHEVSLASPIPVGSYSVSGEYAMLKAAAAQGYLDETNAVCEMAVSIFRAGADFLITYHALQLALWMKEGRLG